MYPLKRGGSQVALRELRQNNLDWVTTIVGDRRITDSFSFDTRSREQAMEMLSGIVSRARQEPRTEDCFAVTTVDDGLVGFARLGLNGVQAAKLGGAIAADHWRRGYAIDAARTLVNVGFRELKLHRISAAMGPDNTASIAIVHRLGMIYEGCIRDHVYTNGRWRKSLLYSVLVDEWAAAGTAGRRASSGVPRD
jgi:[ribosomal protein S5]-alanine N-acetyltransferase